MTLWSDIHSVAKDVDPYFGFVFGVIGIATAFWAYRASQQSEDRLKRIASTRSVGLFPDSVREIALLLSQRTPGEPTLVACDYPTYGIVSAHSAALEIRKHIETDPRAFELVFCTDDVANRQREIRFKKKFDSPDDKLREMLRRCPLFDSDFSKDPVFATFIETLNRHSGITWTLFEPCHYRGRYDGVLPINMWIVGKREAVFTIPLANTAGAGSAVADGASDIEVCFRTQDKHLIEALIEIWKQYRVDATDATVKRLAASASTPSAGPAQR